MELLNLIDSGALHARDSLTATPEIVEFARTRLAFHPDEKQCEVLRSTARRGILNCTRQWGKTTVSAAKVVHRVFTQPESTVIVASPGLRQSGEWLRRATQMLGRLGIPKRGDGYNHLSLLLPNGSRIIGLPDMETTVRGFSAPEMILIDEASRVSDDMYSALLPMLSTNDGQLWLMSTPAGKRGFFYEEWQHGGPEWFRVAVKATDCTRISKRFLEEQRTNPLFEAEYLCEFIGSGANAFDRDLVEAALDNSIEPFSIAQLLAEQPSLHSFLSSHTDKRFFIGIDLGKKRDHSTIAILELVDGVLVVRCAERIALNTPYTQVVEMVRKLTRSPSLMERCTVVVDASGVGEPVVDMLRKADLGCALMAVVITGGDMTQEGRRSGYAHVPKVNLMTGLQMGLERETLKIARRMKESGALVKELLDVRVRDNGGMSADGAGQHDDLVMAVALACWRVRKGFNDLGGGGFL